MHSLIVGMTRMGKTTLAQRLARDFRKIGYKVGVYTVAGTTDGKPDPRWTSCADFVTLDRQKFLERFAKSYKVMWFVDECNRTVAWHDREMEATGTSGSLRGHTMHFISQRAATFNKTVREQCSRLYMFRQGPKDCAELHQAFAHDLLLKGPSLSKGEFIFCTTEPGSARKLDLGLGSRAGLHLGRFYDRETNSSPAKRPALVTGPASRLGGRASGDHQRVGAREKRA